MVIGNGNSCQAISWEMQVFNVRKTDPPYENVKCLYAFLFYFFINIFTL